ncbi:MAG: beta-lactamase family protein [Gemmataceae bacterium]|nr:beta-lactamase family protein [Gemmataceae bacterium]MDW8265474.1 serine hydrolase domain-containing protein [Gemmataceae bacterium]
MRWFTAWIIGIVVVVPSAAQTAEPSSFLRSELQKLIDAKELSGVVTFVGNKDGVLDVQVLGMADLENHLPMQRDTVFRIASMTKPITALAVMQLVEEGKLSVDDPVEKHLPEFRGQMLVASRDQDTLTLKKPSRPITIKDLLTHTSGLPTYPAGVADLYQKRHLTLREATLVVSQLPLLFEPGTRWSYSNTGIDTLGRIIEVVSGLPYDRYLAQRIFEPLRMYDTTPYPTAPQLRRLAMTYAKKDGKLVATPGGVIDYATNARHPVPAGGLFSTGDDLARLYQCLLNGGTLHGRRIIGAKTLADMTTIHTGDLKTGFVEGTGWGYGFAIVREPKGVTEKLSPGSYGHGGAFGTQAWIDPKRGTYAILLIQRSGGGNVDNSTIRKVLHEGSVRLVAGQQNQ